MNNRRSVNVVCQQVELQQRHTVHGGRQKVISLKADQINDSHQSLTGSTTLPVVPKT